MRRISLIAAIALAAVLALLVIAQLVLPGIAEQRLRDRLARSGKVLDVEVHAFPAIDSVRPVSSSGGVLTLQGTATLLGVTSTIDATVRPYRGTLVVSPDVPFGGLATITLFSNPALEVQSVAADPAPGGFSVS